MEATITERLSLMYHERKEQAIKDALHRAIGGEWRIEDLVGRLETVRVNSYGLETIKLDGQPLLEFYDTGSPYYPGDSNRISLDLRVRYFV